METWENALISAETSIREALRVIDSSATKVALVTDESRQLIGTVTDGDVRRGIIRGLDLDMPVTTVMHKKPVSARNRTSANQLLLMMKNKRIHQVPLLDDDGRVVGLVTIDDLIKEQNLDNWAVVMAGGPGKRLRPITNDVPKPLLDVGDRPLLETIVEELHLAGFRRIFLAVNYKAEMIERHFGDGSRWDVQIEYLREEKALGTAGALSLLPEKPTSPLVVMNGDLLTKVDFMHLLRYHENAGSMATMCVREYSFEVPFGVVRLHDTRLTGIDEKPVQTFFVNAGIYVIEPEAIEHIPEDTALDMPQLFERFIDNMLETNVFPVREYWLDVGRFDDYFKANKDFGTKFEE